MKIIFFWWRINTEKEKEEIFGEENIFLAHEMEKERNMLRRKLFLCGREEE